MRVRYIALVVLLIVIPVALVLLFIKRHEGATIPVKSATQLSLNLKGGLGDAALTGCGTTHHFTEYDPSGLIEFSGSVTNPPRGRWRLKLKLKSCIAGRFETAGGAHVHRGHGGRFRGEFTTPVPGLYFARVQLSAGPHRVARSEKAFFRVR
jgi:hypothetical protein